ncbi:MAG: hypothetical protein PHX72_00240 [Candidatus Shapirobacteria bacterium]|nr:hypothetical protein [Candidatus Shapirobacteria bacterium]
MKKSCKTLTQKINNHKKTVLLIVIAIVAVVLIVSALVYSRLSNDSDTGEVIFKNEFQQQIDDLQEQTTQSQTLKEGENDQSENNGDDHLVSEEAVGLIRGVYEKSGKKHLDIDYVQLLSGELAIMAAAEDIGCGEEGVNHEDCVPVLDNDYYVRNQNPQIRTFEISDEVIIENLEKTGNELTQITLTEFVMIFEDKTIEREWLRAALYNIEVKDSKVIRIWQQYLP